MEGPHVIMCYNAAEERPFMVPHLNNIPDQYRRNFYKLNLRLNFFDDAIDLEEPRQVMQICYRKIVDLMKENNLLHCFDSFYWINYEVQLLPRPANVVDQLNMNVVGSAFGGIEQLENYEEHTDEEEEEMSIDDESNELVVTFESVDEDIFSISGASEDIESEADSAYDEPTISSLSSTISVAEIVDDDDIYGLQDMDTDDSMNSGYSNQSLTSAYVSGDDDY